MTATEIALADIAEEWIAARQLPNAMVQILAKNHAAHIQGGQPFSPSIAPRSVCEELDLPQGSTWMEVNAALLDAHSDTVRADGTYRRDRLNAIQRLLRNS